MDILRIFRGSKKKKSLNDEQLRAKEDLISAYDANGDEMHIEKKGWLNKVLLPDIKLNYNNPDKLYSLLITALNDKFEQYIIDAGNHLYLIDSNKERAGCLYAIILMKNNQLKKSEFILQETINEIGKTGTLMTNLAKVYIEMNQDELFLKTLLEGLELDPNQENGLDWYLAVMREKGGEESYFNALQQVSTFENSWRAYILLAKIELEKLNIDKALEYYKIVFSKLDELSYSTVIQISGDLGTHGYIEEILELIEPHFNVKMHGINVGNNLIKANFDLKYYDKARKILDDLKFEYNPTWKKSLDFWDDKLYAIDFKEQK